MMHCYAPLFVNVSDLGRGRSMQWPSDLIGYDALNSYGSPSYYAQKLFSLHHGDEVLGTSAENLPEYTWNVPARTDRNGRTTPASTHQVNSVFYSATHDSQNGRIYVKIVNRDDTPQDVKIEFSGAGNIADKGTATVLKADNRDATNSLNDPTHVVPTTEDVTGLSASFTRTFPPCSITVLELETK
jgi:alpha-N-arabinofuranosidase